MEGTHYRRSLFPLGLWADAIILSTTQVTTVRRDVMPDKARESLGNLEARVFDVDGSYASSFIVLAAKDPSEQIQGVPLEIDEKNLLTSVICG